MEPLPRSFYDRNAVKVAPALLGCVLARRVARQWLLGRIVETEAYVGEHDLACHARAGRTARTEVMYGEPGHAYVYLIYGIHQMLNCVCGPGSDANAVLVRAVEPLAGSAPWLHESASGPGNVCKAFGIKLSHNRADLCAPGGELIILPRSGRPRVVRGPRIGVDYAGTWAAEPLRFCDAKSAHLSRRLRSA
ncbi:MAG TPA: DNA-3-methyladenine glycosylase [Myxococcales bacterium]|nr:DNA-3-methyladenine glycosylase [Myxococcales bacterium]